MKFPQRKFEPGDAPSYLHDLEEFVVAAQRILGNCSTGRIRDPFGGELFFAYRPRSNEAAIRLPGFRKGDIEEIGKAMPDILQRHLEELSRALTTALGQHAQDAMAPLLKRKSVGWPGRRVALFPSEEVRVTSEDGTAIRAFPERDGRVKLPPEERAQLRSRYKAILSSCQAIAKVCKAERSKFERTTSKRNRNNHLEWRAEWLAHAEPRYPIFREEELLLFAQKFESRAGHLTSPSNIALAHLARVKSISVSYIEQCLKPSSAKRKKTHKKPRP